MRAVAGRLGVVILIALAASLGGGCAATSRRDGGAAPGTAVATAPEDLLTQEDVARILGASDVTRTDVELNPEAVYQALYSSGDTRLVIMNVLKTGDWDKLAAIGETQTIEGLGERAMSSTTYGVMFIKGDRLVNIGGFSGHPGQSQDAVTADKLLELSLLVASRM